MYYEINVDKSLKDTGIYKHYFATAPRSITTEEAMIDMVTHFKVVFPAPKYKISVTHWEEIGQGIDIKNF